MTSNHDRAETLVRALHAAVDRDRQTLQGMLTDDVRAWSPTLATASLDELLDELDRRDGAFDDVELNVTALDVGGDHACVEWTVEMTHSGPIVLADGMNIEPSGLRVALHGITVAEFVGDQICSLRQYWDELTVLEQLGALAQ